MKTDCCCDNTACQPWTLRSIFQVMKEAVYHPHAIDLDKRLADFSGNFNDKSYRVGPPAYLSEELLGYKLIGPDTFKGLSNAKLNYLTPEPIIPFCKINDQWSNIPYFGAKNVLQVGVYCTLFRPKLTDNGFCYTMNSFTKVVFNCQLLSSSWVSSPLNLPHLGLLRKLQCYKGSFYFFVKETLLSLSCLHF